MADCNLQPDGTHDSPALEPSQEAVDTYRVLAEAEPAAYLPALATSLWAKAWIRNARGTDLSNALTSVDEAIQIYEDLADHLPDAFNGTLAAARQTRSELLKQLDSDS